MFKQSYLVVLLILSLGGSLMGNADDALQLDTGLDTNLLSQETPSSMTWPMLPGESLNDLARMFYPNNKSMQRQFVAKTLRLNAETQLKASLRFEAPTLLVVPTLKSLSKNASKGNKKPSDKSLKMSYGLKQIVENLPQKLLLEYDELVNKNTFLKEKLVKLNEKIVFLETKLSELKLIFDKTLTLPQTDLPVAPAPSNISAGIAAEVAVPVVTSPVAEPVANQANINQQVTKKVFKNLNKAQVAPASSALPSKTSLVSSFNIDLVKLVLACAVLLMLGALALKKYRERMLTNLSFASAKMQNTVTDFSGYVEKTRHVADVAGPETIQQLQAAKEVEVRLSSTLEEAKLLISVNRGTDAIEHLKMTIESQPKASINHWLYLLEVFRKLNLKDEFEQYADKMHETFNVMKPVWYEKEAAINTVMVVPQSLEEFPHIMKQLDGVWPGELASVYLRSLITDNRGGERAGFGKAVVAEILFLIELLDTYKDIPN